VPLWSSNNTANGSTFFATAQGHKHPDRPNQAVLFANTTANAFIENVTMGQFGVTANATQAAQGKIPHSGWNLRYQWSGGRANRTFYECLVAGSSINSNPAIYANIPDVTIVINSQPQANTQVWKNAASFSVSAVTVPVGRTLVYKWMQNNAFLADAGIYSGTQTATLTISNNSTVNCNNYACMINVAGGSANVNTANALLVSTH